MIFPTMMVGDFQDPSNDSAPNLTVISASYNQTFVSDTLVILGIFIFILFFVLHLRLFEFTGYLVQTMVHHIFHELSWEYIRFSYKYLSLPSKDIYCEKYLSSFSLFMSARRKISDFFHVKGKLPTKGTF